MPSDKNKLEFIPDAPSLSYAHSNSVGKVFASQPGKLPLLSGKIGFVVREGVDPIEGVSTGRVVEGNAGAGIHLRKGSTAFGVTASNIAYRSGLDDPLAQAKEVVGEGSVPSLNFSIAHEYKPDCFASVSYDIKQRKPEASLAWAGRTDREQASLVLHADPLYRTYKLAASVAFPGPEWRETVYDEDKDVIEDPVDDGGRHKLWVAHTVKDRQWAYSTRIGAVFDLGRLVNYVADFVDYNVEPRIPPLIWRMPLSQTLFNLLVPAEDSEQVRHHIRGWDAEVAHEFGRAGPALGLAKHFKFATIRATYDTVDKEAGLQYKRSGLTLGAKIARTEGMGWRNPSLQLHVEPLGLL
uniref:Uncharacterized protein n=1 Tax=Dunaliella tertiolecta TaxID=3047 RepID=A0A7S3VU95_DUNTE|mmetsp:Transcript_21050/g.58481  ORF Transcript_21050/g.58481 Transcript_21050/m.58481 type:complete len:353 (+) Transcript_21050:127-1185(+)|eukprot:CAMPEP_0202348846 /NCGR_PEP_ID=MMETSP1126-20121109/6587_1 /ASSEMBLY_ACC=CAM_ASM_000457 /TAXON_ID=3047 /ORGANISM="Dunaliella tertiolecta, Strain CCMP1320" /LENGTH=352 /DNA_ID=CAMNT_0048940563 /DNA_START=183 /DNA_END=1241 /DNA_ORIENTATION=-